MMFRVYILVHILICFSVSVHAQEITSDSVLQVSQFTLMVEGIQEVNGEVRIAMFDAEHKYPEDPIHAIILPVHSSIVKWTLQDLPFGEYAIAVYHDKNKNGKLDSNLLGIPKEDYGFSNNARGRFGPASWKDASFSVQKTHYVERIQIE